MNSIKYLDLEPKNGRMSTIFTTSLALVLIVFAFTMSSASSFFQIVKPVEAAGTLSNIAILPTNNIANTRTTYDVIFKTATAGTIENILMTFPNSFDVSAATTIIEKSGIGSGSLSPSCSISICNLKYTVTSPKIVPAGTTIRLEIAKIVNSNTAGSFKVGISTEAQVILDGPTPSPSFPIKRIGSSTIDDKSITGDDVSPSFMIRKTLYDDDAGHAHGWDPNGNIKSFAIYDSDIDGASDSEFISVMIRYANLAYCTASPGDTGLFVVHCNNAPVDSAVLDYVITRLPANVVTSTDTSTFKTSSLASFNSSQDIASFAKHDDIASEFP